MTDALTFYRQPAVITEPGPYANYLNGLPTGIEELCKVVQGLTIHVFWAERYGLKLPEERQGELQLRTLQRRLARMLELDSRPFIEPRPLDKKIVGNCRDFSLLLVSILRHQGVPARARCGFGTYFIPNHFEDHWVAEYWNRSLRRWVLVDAQLDSLQCEAMKIAFDPLDVPRDQYIAGGRAWQMCRREGVSPDSFGIFNLKGLGFVRGDLVRDVASLNKVELLPWDCWGIIEKEDLSDPVDLALLDRLADLTCADVPDFEMVRDLYLADSRLSPGPEIHSYTGAGMETIVLTP